MPLAPWRSQLARALHRNRSRPDARYFQLATVRPDGRPANRTVVFRGFLDNTDRLKIVTDARSEKISQIEHQSWGEVCWYFPKTQEQFRLAGELTLVGVDCPDPALSRARLLAWQALSDKARSQFAWPHPGQARTADKSAFSHHAPNPEQPLSNFCLLLLDPTDVDHLELRGDPQNRWRYQRNCDRSWSKQAVNP